MEEAFHVAIMLVGIMSLHKKKYWLQIVSDTEGRPDIKTGCYKEPWDLHNDTWVTHFVEVVTFEGHSSEKNLLDFLKRTKLTKTTPYDPQTIILCRIDKDFHIPPLQQLEADFKKENFQNPVIILGKISPDKELYKIAQINPQLDLVKEFDLEKELKKDPHTRVLNLKRGPKTESKYEPDVKHYPFEKLGIV